MMLHEWQRGDYVISTDRTRLDVAAIHGFLQRSYWAQGIARERVARAITHSLCFGIYHCPDTTSAQAGFGRLVTDYTSFAYVADVFVLEPHRGRGLGKWLVQCMLQHPELQTLRRWLLVTLDAHGLYHQAGFTPIRKPERYLILSHTELD